MLILGANDDAQMLEQHMRFGVQFAAEQVGGVELVDWFSGRSLGDGREHFGFKDGLSQPVPALPTPDGWEGDGQLVAPGEFILGQPDEYGRVDFDEPTWARDGSYVVFRGLCQLVDLFESDVQQQVEVLAASGVAVTTVDLSARMMGRSRESDVVDGDYSSDPHGDRWPLFAHIRKANPRDHNHAQSNRHRIIRRGIPYGSAVEEDRGLLFVAYQASIARQFEFIQTEWLGVTTFPTPAAHTPHGSLSPLRAPGADPFTGWESNGRRTILYHKPEHGSEYSSFVPLNLASYVRVVGSGYFFSPSLAGISRMLNSS